MKRLTILLLLALAFGACTDMGPTQGNLDQPSFDRDGDDDDALEATAVAVGAWHACALDDDGEAYCWGDNRYGQLGDGSNVSSLVPVQVDGDRRDGHVGQAERAERHAPPGEIE